MSEVEAPGVAERGPLGQLEHPALLHDGLEGFLSFMVPFVREGIERGHPVLVAVGAGELAALRGEVDAPGVRWADTREWHPHPASRLRAFYEHVTRELRAGATRVRLVGQPVWPKGPPEFVREWQRCESVLNEVLGPFPVTLVCTYDTSRLDPSIVASSRRTHPLIEDGDPGPSEEFEEPEGFLSSWSDALSAPPPSAVRMEAPVDVGAARRFIGEEALRAGLEPERILDVSIAATEVMANATVHGSGVLSVAAWTEGGHFLCQIEDAGRGLADPLAGYRPPMESPVEGRGLWLARQVVDLLQIEPTPVGTRIRLHMELPAGH